MNTQQATIETKIITEGNWTRVQIISVTYGYSQHLKNGEWVNCTATPERCEDIILTLGKYFFDYNDAEKYTTTKQFKALLKTIQKNW